MVDDIFSTLAAHMVKGLMIHEQLMHCFSFIGLDGYAKCHEYHYISETKGYINLCRYYLDHYRRLIKPSQIDVPDIIPATWYDTSMLNVDPQTRVKAVKAALEEWIEWERSAVHAYEKACGELFGLGEYGAFQFIEMYLIDTKDELKIARDEFLHKSMIEFDMVSIHEEQSDLKDKYEKLLKKVY